MTTDLMSKTHGPPMVNFHPVLSCLSGVPLPTIRNQEKALNSALQLTLLNRAPLFLGVLFSHSALFSQDPTLPRLVNHDQSAGASDDLLSQPIRTLVLSDSWQSSNGAP